MNKRKRSTSKNKLEIGDSLCNLWDHEKEESHGGKSAHEPTLPEEGNLLENQQHEKQRSDLSICQEFENMMQLSDHEQPTQLVLMQPRSNHSSAKRGQDPNDENGDHHKVHA